MNRQEAKRIIESYGVIEVRHAQAPVWIEQINDDETAEVRELNTDIRMEVPLAELERSSIPADHEW
ncbi:H-type small acid-soluble spore protein [Hydrogenispora ethanolica]|uniref:H-type small acid-soluble spore protein n=1 Tax=Hydrogenispora ethanolica TaxID=1082276 RepID=A0A4R1RFH8_HYDET|nr:small, acid-soluble spore protein, H family [Hydrogenispora ethanolica]TCL64703.1 H-type small acid-soluble spore protein [Hydrogenispora ethanolica]